MVAVCVVAFLFASHKLYSDADLKWSNRWSKRTKTLWQRKMRSQWLIPYFWCVVCMLLIKLLKMKTIQFDFFVFFSPFAWNFPTYAKRWGERKTYFQILIDMQISVGHSKVSIWASRYLGFFRWSHDLFRGVCILSVCGHVLPSMMILVYKSAFSYYLSRHVSFCCCLCRLKTVRLVCDCICETNKQKNKT